MTHEYILMSGDFEILFIIGLFDFELTYAILTHVKSHFWTVFHLNSFLPFVAVRGDRCRILLYMF